VTSDPDEVWRATPVEGRLDCTVTDVPGSKSITNRALVCAALADGTSTLRGVAPGDDSVAMLRCLERLGAGVSMPDEEDDHPVATIAGTGGRLAPGPVTLDAELAGTTSRFVTALAALGDGPYVIDGRPPLRSRPMGPLHEALAQLGARVDAGEREGHLPVTLGRGTLGRGADRVQLPGDVSSQYVTALMLIGPYLPAGLTIELTTPLVSRPYVELTRTVMASFGVEGVEVGTDRIRVEPGAYRPTDYAVEVDASSASYPLAAAAICGGRVTIEGLGADSLQGDARFAELLAAMGASVERTATSTSVTVDRPLDGIDVDMADISDTVQSLAVIAPFAGGSTTIEGVGFIRGKETDRIGSVVHELRRCGVGAEELPDGLTIHPGPVSAARVATYHDHRMAMSFALIGLRVAGLEVADPGVVSKSWPGFWRHLSGLAASAH
jgi:3-phosphoshikimate 1-carboxyvinyltransferase